MDDSCAVCAETLEWVAYGPCGHREVCSTCIIRLRFICNDRCCCICKSESNIIFVTKALGDYTRMINDFSAFPANPIEGQVGQYWFHEGAQAYFDDLDHYKIIKAMCRLSCNVCERKNEQRNGGSKRIGDFKGIEQLKIHLFHQHRLFMCSLCLEGRKIFISEQKLYNRAQLNQHVKTGDSMVDGSESERGGFMGHPVCEFCQNPFYGDNELYLHMSTEHFTCHICQRQHPGQYEYYNDYDDLEIHFRQGHFLCEDEACLAKKFIVFATESEMKRHGAMDHGGCMSRSKRNAALQIPTSFRYQRSAEQDRRHRDRRNRSNSSNTRLSKAIQDSLETSNAFRFHEISSNAQAISSHRETSEIKSMVNPFEPLAATDSGPSSRCCQALGQNSASTLLEESSFPPLPMAPSSSIRISRNGRDGVSGNTMAALLRDQNTVKVLNSSRASLAASCRPNSSASISNQSRPVLNSGFLSSSSSPSSSQDKLAITHKYVPSSHASSIQSGPSTANDLVLCSNGASSPRTQSNTSKVSPSSSAPNLVDIVAFDKSISNSQVSKVTRSSQLLLKVEDVQSANKDLVEKIRAALDFDGDKFAAFKVISVEYRQDLIDTGEYLAYVHQFGLSHLVLELAMLCPNAQKQRELVEIHKYNTRRNGSNENGLNVAGRSKSKKSSKKGKEKCKDNRIGSSENALADSLNSGMMKMQLNQKPSLEDIVAFDKSVSNSQVSKVTRSNQLLLKVEDVQSANKDLVEKIRAALDFDGDKFAAFKVLSVEYRQDLIDTGEYLAYVHQFGLSHLILELAMLCPDAQKQRELVEIHKYNTRRNGSNENGLNIDSRSKSKKSSKKGKEKCEDNRIGSSENALADSLNSGKLKILFDDEANFFSSVESRNENDAQSASGCSKKIVEPGGVGNKPRKKRSKFLRNGLGDTSAAAFPDNGDPDAGPDENGEKHIGRRTHLKCCQFKEFGEMVEAGDL